MALTKEVVMGESAEEYFKRSRCSFRFFHLSKEQADRVVEANPQAKIRPSRKVLGAFVVSFQLVEDGDYSWLDALISLWNLSQEDFGFFLSLLTARDSDIVSLPVFVGELFRRMGGCFDFSFTFIED